MDHKRIYFTKEVLAVSIANLQMYTADLYYPLSKFTVVDVVGLRLNQC